MNLTSGVLCPIVLACDENFAMPLATLLRSLVDWNRRHWPLEVTILNDGFSERGRERVRCSLPDGAATLRWQAVDLAQFDALSPMTYLSRMTYARLQIERYFANDVSRVLYLDADMLVLADIAALIETDLKDQPVGAVADDFVDDALRHGRDDAVTGVPRVGRYFNAGMLLIDLPRWRHARIADRAMEYLVHCPASPYSDQDALNVVCDGAWTAVAKRWNFQGHVKTSVSDLATNERPAITHFITADKPWRAESVSLNAALYATYWDKTAYRRTPLERLTWSWSRLAVRIRNKLRRSFA